MRRSRSGSALIAGFVLLGINGHAKADEKCVTTDDLFCQLQGP
jgi:hypothetical protein